LTSFDYLLEKGNNENRSQWGPWIFCHFGPSHACKFKIMLLFFSIAPLRITILIKIVDEGRVVELIIIDFQLSLRDQKGKMA
jgi:hypothetical protein